MADPPSVIVTVVDVASVLSPSSVAVTETVVVAASSPMVAGSTLRVMAVGAVSSSAIVVSTDDVSRLGACPPPPDGLEIVIVKVSPVPSSSVSSVVWTVKVCDPAAVRVNVSVPDLAV